MAPKYLVRKSLSKRGEGVRYRAVPANFRGGGKREVITVVSSTLLQFTKKKQWRLVVPPAT
jgi:hypothetical protein